jgi:hypothetical protein
VAKIFATRVLKNATIDSDFPANGLALDILRANAQHDPSVCLSPNGSLAAAWEYDFSVSDHDIYGAVVTNAGALTFSTGLHGSGINDQRPAICSEAGVFSLAWQQGAKHLYSRHSFDTGAAFGSDQTVTLIADPSVGPKVCPDGWGGTYIGYGVLSGGFYNVHASRFFGGVEASTYGPLASAQPSNYFLGKLEYAGGFQAWLSYWTLIPALQASMVPLFREGSGTVATIFGTGLSPSPQLASDGAGGAILAAQTAAGSFVQGTRRNVASGAPGLWGGTPPRLAQLIREVVPTAICSDGNAGALLFVVDSGFVPSLAHFVRADRWGALDGAPYIQSVKDVVNDQGGHVRVSWSASYLDNEVSPIVDSYRLWRQVPTASPQSLLWADNHALKPLSEDSNELIEPGSIRVEQTATGAIAWELVTTQIANAFASYSLTVETAADSTGGGLANTLYMVEARSNSSGIGWASPPDSGHSVDNLGPATPSPFTGAIVGGANTRLDWGRNHETDLAGYELHHGSSASFVPGPGNLTTATSDTTFLDPSVGQFYKLAAIDIHGNRSGYALLTPGGTLDTPGPAAPREPSLVLASANPSARGAMFRYAVPRAGRVRLALFGVDGRCTRELVAGEVPAGEFTVSWDGRDAGGHDAASGIYFARLSVAGRELVTRFAMTH